MNNVSASRDVTEVWAFWAWAAIGCIGSAGLALAGTGVGAVPDPGHALWWFAVARNSSVMLECVFYASIGLLTVAWLGVGRLARLGLLTTRQAWLLLALWAVPLVLAPPLFSRDLYSYVSQGMIAHSGLNPYSVGPSVLGPGHLLGSVASSWRHTPAPYGPLFVTITRGVAAVFGSTLTAEILALRALELAGVAMMMWCLPRLARNLGTDPGLALWLGVLSPLALFSSVASGHNDALMLGLLVGGLTFVTDQKVVAGLVLCGLATTVKLPAAIAVVFIAAWKLRGQSSVGRLTVLAKVIVVPVATVVVVTWACGMGWTWLSPNALRVPAESQVLPTPSVALGTFLFHVLHLAQIHVPQTVAVRVSQALCVLVAVVGTIWLAGKARTLDVVRLLGLALIVIVLAGPTVWPWYLLWSLVLLAVTSAQRSKALAVVAALGMLMVGPSGSPILKGDAYVVVLLGCAATCWWLVGQRRWLSTVEGGVVPSVG